MDAIHLSQDARNRRSFESVGAEERTGTYVQWRWYCIVLLIANLRRGIIVHILVRDLSCTDLGGNVVVPLGGFRESSKAGLARALCVCGDLRHYDGSSLGESRCWWRV